MNQKNKLNEKMLINCYGCRAAVNDITGPKHEYIGSDAGCWEVFCEVLAKEYMNYNELWLSHRLTVDAYAAQHPGDDSRKAVQSAYIHLTRLYIQLEKNLTARQANDFMKKVSSFKHEYKQLNPPDFSGTLNILDVAKAKDMDEHKLFVEEWAKSVWQAWSQHHSEIKAFAEKVLSGSMEGRQINGQ